MDGMIKVKIKTKQKHDFGVLINSLGYYLKVINSELKPHNPQLLNELKASYSAVFHLQEKYMKKYRDMYASKTPRLQELYHDALLIREALAYYQAATDNLLEERSASRLWEEVDHQIIEIEKPKNQTNNIKNLQHGTYNNQLQ